MQSRSDPVPTYEKNEVPLAANLFDSGHSLSLLYDLSGRSYCCFLRKKKTCLTEAEDEKVIIDYTMVLPLPQVISLDFCS